MNNIQRGHVTWRTFHCCGVLARGDGGSAERGLRCLNFTLGSLTVADDYSAEKHPFFYVHDAGSLSLYPALLRPARFSDLLCNRIRRQVPGVTYSGVYTS
jgi:hypothetical protein